MDFNIFAFAESIGVKLTEEQEKAIRTVDQNVAVVAVPGSGKTAVFVLRLAKLIKENNVSAENILALTFSKASAKDMEKRFDKWCSEIISEKPNFSTIHSFAYSILKQYDTNFSAKNVIEGDNDKNRKNDMLKRIYMNFNKEYPNEETMKNMVGKIGYFKNLMISANAIIEDTSEVPHFKEIFSEYELQKKVRGLYDFDDLLDKACDLLHSKPEVLKYYQEKYKYIQIDEYQDTSRIQNELIKTIFSSNTNLFVVGDDDQSIYKFRGASPEDFLDFRNNFPNSIVLYMTKNFRSTKTIVNSANGFIKLNSNRYIKDVKSTRRNGAAIKIADCPDDLEQVKFVLNILKSKKDLGSIAILYRNNVSAIPFIDAFIKNDITFSCYGTKDFFQNWVVKDMIAFMNLANNFYDIDAFRTIYMKHYISKEIAEYVCDNISDTKNIFDLLIEAADKFCGSQAETKKEIFRRLHFQYLLLKDKRPVYKALEYIENEFKYLEYLDKKGPANSLSVSILKQNLSIVKSVAKGCTTQIEFMEHIDKIAKITEENEINRVENPKVYMKTIHSSKGLEWDTVFMVDLIHDIFPSITSIAKIVDNDDYNEIYEERRLFYVGMTRAKNNLYLCYPKHNPDGKFVVPSLFLKELEDTLKYGTSYALNDIVDMKSAKKKKRQPKKSGPQTLSITDTTTFPTNTQNILDSAPTNSIVKQVGANTVIDLSIGDTVKHKNPILGEGTVVELNTDKNAIKINFNGAVKAYALDYCIKFNLLTKK